MRIRIRVRFNKEDKKEFGKDDREGVLLFLAAAKMRQLGNKVAEMEKAEQERNYKERNEFK